MILESDYGILHYFKTINKYVNPQMYEPVSFENWKMLRELEPGKFSGGYEFYIKSKEEQYEVEVERRRNCEIELCSVHYNIDKNNLEDTKKNLKIIEGDILFEKWVNKELANKIINK
jgi:hypothetical protein